MATPEAELPKIAGSNPDSLVGRVASIRQEKAVAEKPVDNEGISKPARYGLHGVAEIVSTPGILGAVPGLLGAAWDYATDENVKSFQHALIDPHYRYLVGELLDAEKKGDHERVASIASVLPKDPGAIMRGGLRYAMDFYNVGTEAAKLLNDDFNRTPGEVPYDEEAAGIVLSAAVGAPATLASKAAQKGAMHTAGRALEIVTPLTLPLSPGNFAANAAAGVAINDVMRGLNAESSVTKILRGTASDVQAVEAAAPEIPDTDELIVNASPAPEDSGISTTAKVAAGLAVIGAAGYALRGKYRAQPRVKRFIDAGKMHERVGPETEAGIGEVRAAISSRITQGSGLERMLRIKQNENVAEAFADTLSRSVRSGGEAGVRMLADTGEMPNSGIVTVPMGDLFNRASTLTADQINTFNEGAVAMSVRADRRVNPGRTVAEDWTDADVQARIDAMEADPALKQMYDDVQRIYSDVADYRLAMGDIDKATRAEWTKKWGGAYLPNIQARPEDVTPPTLWGRVKQAITTAPATSQYTGTRLPRDTARGDLGVNVFDADVLGAMEAYVDRHVKRIQMNNARRDYADMMGYQDPNVKDPLLAAAKARGAGGRTEGSLRARRIHNSDVPPQWRQTQDPRPDPSRNVIRIRRNGADEFIEFGDGFVARELEFAPHAQLKFFNAARRLWQQGTTGLLRPDRAPLAAFWDTTMGMLTRRPERAMGYIDELVLRATGGRMNFFTYDPTAYLWNIEGAARGAYGQGVREMQRFVQQGLLDGSSWLSDFVASPVGVGTRMAQQASQVIPGVTSRPVSNLPAQSLGQAKLDQWSRDLLKLYHSTTYYHMYGHGYSNSSWLADAGQIGKRMVNSEVARQMPVENTAHRIFHNAVSTTFQNTILRPYQIAMDSVHNGAKYAYTARNIAILEKQKGRALTNDELTRVAREAKSLAGDMTRHVDFGDVGNMAISSIPYANVAIQSMAHIGRHITSSPRHFAQFVSSMGMLAGSVWGFKAVVDAMGGADWYYNEMPAWQRNSSLVMPDPDAFARWYQDPESYQFSSDDMLIMSLPPEIMPGIMMGDYILDEVVGLEMSRTRVQGGRSDDFFETLLNMVGVPTPPGVNIVRSGLVTASEIATGQDQPIPQFDLSRGLREADLTQAARIQDANRLAGIEGNTLHANTYLADNVHDMLSSTMGVFGRMLGEMGEAYFANQVGSDRAQVDKSFDVVMDNSPLRQATETMSGRMMGASLWTGYNKKHLSSPRSDAVHDRLQQLEGVFRQYGVEIYGVPGQGSAASDMLYNAEMLNIAQRVDDPNARRMVGLTYNTFKRNGAFNYHMQRVNTLRREHSAIAGNFRIAPHQKQLQLNEVVEELQGHYEWLADHGAEYESRMKREFGPEWSIDAMIDYIKDAATVQPTAGSSPSTGGPGG